MKDTINDDHGSKIFAAGYILYAILHLDAPSDYKSFFKEDPEAEGNIPFGYNDIITTSFLTTD